MCVYTYTLISALWTASKYLFSLSLQRYFQIITSNQKKTTTFEILRYCVYYLYGIENSTTFIAINMLLQTISFFDMTHGDSHVIDVELNYLLHGWLVV